MVIRAACGSECVRSGRDERARGARRSAGSEGRKRRKRQLLMVSARSGKALERGPENLVEHLEGHREMELGDVAYMLQVGRKSLGIGGSWCVRA